MSPFTMYPTQLPQRHHQRPLSSCMISCYSIEWAESSSTGVSGPLWIPLAVSHNSPHISDKLRANLLLKQYFMEVDLRHVGLYNDELAHAIQDRPTDVLPLVSRLPAVHIHGSHSTQ